MPEWLWRMWRAPLRIRKLFASPKQLGFPGDRSPRDQQEQAERLQAARRQVEVVSRAMADAERHVKTAAWQCVRSGHSYSDTAKIAGVDTDTLRGWVAEVSDAWGSPAGM